MSDVISPDGTRIRYNVDGEGPALLLVHGFAMSRARWRDVGYVDRLAQDFRVVSMDLRGHGDSEKPADAGTYAPHKVVADVLAVLDAVGTSAAAYWGYSLGGKVARMMMVQAPERLTAVVMGGSAPGSVNIVGVQTTLDALRQGIGRYVEMTDARGILTPEARAFFLQNDAAALAAFLAAHSEWDEVEPLAERPMLVYAGTAIAADRNAPAEVVVGLRVGCGDLLHRRRLSRLRSRLRRGRPWARRSGL